MANDNADERQEGEREVLLELGNRRDNQTGCLEKLRFSLGRWNGRINVDLRLWYLAERPGPDGDGHRPTKKGISIREAELDEVIQVLNRARDMVHSEGRATCRPAPGERNPRPRTLAKQQARAAREPVLSKPIQADAFDDLAEFRGRRR